MAQIPVQAQWIRCQIDEGHSDVTLTCACSNIYNVLDESENGSSYRIKSKNYLYIVFQRCFV
jgi:hypothetical protein